MPDLQLPDDVQALALALPPELRKPRLRRWEASRYLLLVFGLNLAPATLAKYACIGGGPAFHKANRIPLYPVGELNTWALERLGRVIRSTSEIASVVSSA